MALFTPFQITLIVMAIVTYIFYIKSVRSKYPPGPWPLPIIGNLHLLSKKPYKEFIEMVKDYGPIFTIWIGWQPAVVLSGLYQLKVATVDKGLDFAGRCMDSAGFKAIFRDNEGLTTRSYDQKVVTMRKLAESIVKTKAIGGFSPMNIVEEETQHLLDILKEANGELVDPFFLIHMSVSNTIMRTVLNIRFKNEADPEFLLWSEANTAVKNATEKAILMSVVPSLSRLMIGTQKEMRLQAKLRSDFIEKHVKYHEATYQEGVIRDLTDTVIRYQRLQGNKTDVSLKLTKVNVFELLRDILGGGTQTTLADILWIFLVLLYRKDIRQKIQLELDQYLVRRKADFRQDRSGEDRDKNQNFSNLIFTVSDRPDLPYLNAVIHETMRLYPVGPLGLPHRAMVDTSVGKHTVPQDTIVLFNIYGFHRDGSIWQKPLEFIPERFLDINGNFDQTKAKQLLSFGAGPRRCVGQNFAKMQTFVSVANILHTFELCCPFVDELPGLEDGNFHLEHLPYPFEMMFKPRNLP